MDWNTKTTTIFPCIGWTVDQSIDYAIDMAKQKKTTVELQINDICLTINYESCPGAVKKVYQKLLKSKKR
jgi:hypothetical protein